MTFRRARDDRGFTLIETLVTVIIVGIIVAITVPVFFAQQAKVANASVKADLRNYAAPAKTYFTSQFAYPTTIQGFAKDGTAVIASKNNTFRAFVVPSGVDAGYVIYGMNSKTSNVYVVSSYDDKDPQATTFTALPVTPPVRGTLGMDATTGPLPGDWSSTAGIDAQASITTRAPFQDPTFVSPTRTVLSTVPVANVYPYNPASFRFVDLISPVASRAVEVFTTGGTWGQGLILYPNTPASTWPVATKVIASGEKWTASVWVKANVGQGMSVGCRVQGPLGDSQYVTQVSGAGSGVTVATTGNWQRISYTCTSDATWMGKYVAVQVYTPDTTPGRTYFVTAPQLDRAAAPTSFALSPTL
jgi:prepilin-type N-terminal cleavage/methylation domain-containing protein